MKNFKILTGLAIATLTNLSITSCNNIDSKYKNLETGEKVIIIKSETGLAMDSVSGEPVAFYVNTETQDTIEGKTGNVVNNKLMKNADGGYHVHEMEAKSEVEQLLESGEDVKIKVDGDEIKIKTDDKKIKIDGNEKTVKDR